MGVSYNVVIRKFASKGEKTGWTYIPITATIAAKIKPGCNVSFRVKGKLDEVSIEKVAVLPMGDGSFILPLNGTLRKKLKKEAGSRITVTLASDERELKLDADLMSCLRDDPSALSFFNGLTRSHQQYFSKWIGTAKTTLTREKRILMAVEALSKGMGFSEMMRANRKVKEE